MVNTFIWIIYQKTQKSSMMRTDTQVHPVTSIMASKPGKQNKAFMERFQN